MIATPLNPSQSQTAKESRKVPDRLLREEPETCGACHLYGKRHPDCTCPDPKVLPLKEQTLASLFGSEGVRVYIPQILLQGYPEITVCDDLQHKLNAAYESGDVICVLSDDYVPVSDGPIQARVVFDRSYGDLWWPKEMQEWRNYIRRDLIATVDERLSEIKVKSMFTSSDFFDHAATLVRG